MFFGVRKRQHSARDTVRPGDPFASETAERASPQWDAWRRSAQDVTRAWNEWLAAHGREQPERYRRYASAVIGEERAAVQLERTIARDPQLPDAGDRAASAAGGGETRAADG